MAVGTTIYAAPFDAKRLLVLETTLSIPNFPIVDTEGVASGAGKWSGIVAVGTKVVAAPYGASRALIFDHADSALTSIGTEAVYSGAAKWSGLVSVGTTVYAAPYDSPQMLVLDLTYGTCEGAGPQGTWNGNGLYDCAAAADSSGNPAKGYCENSDGEVSYPYTQAPQPTPFWHH